MGRATRHNTFKSMENATDLTPYAREAAANHSVLFVDTTRPVQTVPPLRSSPCLYDLPVGRMAEALVQIALKGMAGAALSAAPA